MSTKGETRQENFTKIKKTGIKNDKSNSKRLSSCKRKGKTSK